MKARISQEARDTRALFIEFKEIKNKCERVLRQNGLPSNELEQFRELEQQFVLDLNLLPIEQITQRRNRVMQAIDQIMVIESDIKLKLLRKQARTQESQQESTPSTMAQTKPQPAAIQQYRETRMKSSYEPAKNVPKQTRQKPMNCRTPAAMLPLEKEELQSIKNELSFDHCELLNVWGRYKPAQGETCDDKLDRLGRIVGNLRINLKTITTKEKEATVRTNLSMHPEHQRLMQQVEQLKMANEQLRVQNAELYEENRTIRMGYGAKGLSMKGDQKLSLSDQRFDTLYECEDFKIVKISSRLLRTRHSSNYSLEKAKEQHQDVDLPNLIKYTHLLQERIVDSLPVRSMVKGRHHAISTTSTIDLEKRQSESPVKLMAASQLSKGTPEELSTHSEVNSVQNLSQINAKLSNIREQRKKMFEDDQLWGEIERLKI